MKELRNTPSFFGYQVVEQTSGQNLPLIGTDEVGNGSYFGGLAVVASFVTPDQHDFLRKLGVGDSKTLTDQKIRQIAPILKEKIQHQALLLSPSKYNEVIGDRYNAVSVKVALHNQAIYLLLQKGIQPEKIVIDAFTSAKNYDKYLAQEVNRFSNPISLEEKAEGKYLAVAVSSIIARDLFLEILKIWDENWAINFQVELERLLIRWQARFCKPMVCRDSTSVPNCTLKILKKRKNA